MNSTTQPDSLPFLLTRSAELMSADAIEDDDDGETGEIPSSRSVPPHCPPVGMITNETDLPSVIVDGDVEDEHVELQRESDVDGLLYASETLDFPLEPVVPASQQVTGDVSEDVRAITQRTRVRSGRGRTFLFATAAVLTVAGGALAGLKVTHHAYPAPLNSLSAVLHAMR